MNQYSALLKRDGEVVAFPFKQTSREEAIKFTIDVFGNEKTLQIDHCDRSGKKISTIFEPKIES